MEQRIAEGNPGKRRVPAVTLVGGRAKVSVPRGMERDVAAVFRSLAGRLDRVLDAADVEMVEAAAVAVARARAAGRDVAARGLLVPGRFEGPDGTVLVENPSVKQERDAWAAFRAYAEQLGLGPSARARLSHLAVDGREPDLEIEGLAEVRQLRSVAGGGE